MYYQRLDVKRAITDFASASGINGVRECSFYNHNVRSIQRHLDGSSQAPIHIDKIAELDRVLAMGASAFYCSYWRYRWGDLATPVGRDLVWTIRAKQGGLKFTQEATVWTIEALEQAGISEPWVKYSGELGFDLAVPLETIPCEIWAGSIDALHDLHDGLTSYIVSVLRERSSDILVDGGISPIEITRGKETCLLSELRVRRGLLLAPMSLNPHSGLVSVTLDPKRVMNFAILDASPADARGFEWEPPSRVSHELLGHVRPWQHQNPVRLPQADIS